MVSFKIRNFKTYNNMICYLFSNEQNYSCDVKINHFFSFAQFFLDRKKPIWNYGTLALNKCEANFLVKPRNKKELVSCLKGKF